MNSERYNYQAAVAADILEWLKENQTGHITDERRDEIYDELFTADSVTGNASGSYTFSAWVAEENICHNWNLIERVEDEFGAAEESKKYDPEFWDVSIRCLILGDVLGGVVDAWNEKHPEEDADEGREG